MAHLSQVVDRGEGNLAGDDGGMKMEWFGKYVGIQGVLALMLVLSWIVSPYFGVLLVDGYTEIMFLVLGFYFAKNGANVVAGARNVLPKKTG